jgi:hypothetical protein
MESTLAVPSPPLCVQFQKIVVAPFEKRKQRAFPEGVPEEAVANVMGREGNKG